MSIIAHAFAGKALNTYDVFRDMLVARTSGSGKVVNYKTALEVSTVLACARVRANGVAQVPLKLMRESVDGKTRLPAKEHPLYDILGCKTNDWQTSFEFFQTLMFHLALCGKHFSFVNRSSRSGIMELIPFAPGSVTVKRAADFSLTYDVRGENGEVQRFPAEAIWHIKGPSWDSWQGLEAVHLAREAIGLSMAIEESQARMQKNGVRVSGTYSVEGTLKDDQYKSLKKWVDENYAGTQNAGGAMVLDRGAKWLNTSMTGVDAQTLETRRFQVEEVCRHLGVNPILVYAESKNTTYASAEQMFLGHLVHEVAPDYQMLEQSIRVNLLTAEERKSGLYANFVEEGLLRGSAETTKDVILGYVNGGLMTTNEGRAKLDMNPDRDPASDKLRVPANIVGAEPKQPATQANEPDDGARFSVTPVKAMPALSSIPMMANPFYFIRHGESTSLDSLTDTGKEQATAAAGKLKDAGITAIYCSNLGRARDTAETIGQMLGVPVTVLPGLAERNFAEPLQSFGDRTAAALASIPADGVPLIVAHAGTYRWLSMLVGNTAGAESVTNGIPILFTPQGAIP